MAASTRGSISIQQVTLLLLTNNARRPWSMTKTGLARGCRVEEEKLASNHCMAAREECSLLITALIR